MPTPTPTPAAVVALLGDALDPLKTKREQLAEEMAAAKTHYDDLHSAVRAIDRVLRAGGLVAPVNGQPPAHPEERRRDKWVPSEPLIIRVREALPNLDPDGFTIKDAAEEAGGMAEETAKKSLEYLREKGEVVFLGKRLPKGSRGHSKALHFKAASS